MIALNNDVYGMLKSTETKFSGQSILHVGCGGSPLPEWLEGKETRLDIDPHYHPDIVADMTNLGNIGQFDSVYSSHCLEHLSIDGVKLALSEIYRVLKPKGSLLLFVPDLEGVFPSEEILFISPAGPITGLDLYYGHQKSIGESKYMQHRSGFITSTLHNLLMNTGFSKVKVTRMVCHNLFGVAVK